MHDYQQRGVLFSWIRKIPYEDREWARAYMRRKSMYVASNEFEEHNIDTSYTNDPQHREIDSQLRNAWRQRKARKKRTGRKAYNFVLSTQSKRKLDEIAEQMHSSITDALRNVIELEHERKKSHAQALKDAKKEGIHLKEKHKNELNDIKQVLRATEDALNLQTMKLAFTQLQLEKRYAQHAPQDALKEEVLLNFHMARQDIKNSMGLLAQGLIVRVPDTDALWKKVTTGSPSDGES